VDLGAFAFDQQYAVVDRERAEVERARQFTASARSLRSRIVAPSRPEHELRRVLSAQHESAPQLLARELVGERHQRVVDLDQVFVAH
jgi:hypothetical protein